MKYILDTDGCIELIRRKPPKLIQRLTGSQPGDVGLSSITTAELWFGVAKSDDPGKNRKALAGFLAPFEIVPFDESAAMAYGEIRAALEIAGTPIGSMDLLIGAHALSIGATLVTANIREFRRIRGLRTANWLSP
ncbi:MAG: type II toxin-antitoxin system VapC family toxin [Deltaproteobacteria bacterium]|nr:type II toxin-antitoxin system VapC family toxin [Deltaproteobacteria bacterium]